MLLVEFDDEEAEDTLDTYPTAAKATVRLKRTMTVVATASVASSSSSNGSFVIGSLFLPPSQISETLKSRSDSGFGVPVFHEELLKLSELVPSDIFKEEFARPKVVDMVTLIRLAMPMFSTSAPVVFIVDTTPYQ